MPRTIEATGFGGRATWSVRGCTLVLGDRTLVMGVLNVTPDSFSDGGRYDTVERAVERADELVRDGADILDIGGESTRPGSDPVPEGEELRRVLPVLEAVRLKHPRILLSIDTMKAGVAEAACQAGADIVNDVSAATADPGMPAVLRRHDVGVVLMHRLGPSKTMQADPRYDDVVSEVAGYLDRRVRDLAAAGIPEERLCVDPGIGFGKTVEHNVALVHGIPALAAGGRPVLVGLSRKSFLGALTGLPVEDRLAPSLAGLAVAVLRGAHIVRVHDVKESCAASRVADMFRRKAATCSS